MSNSDDRGTERLADRAHGPLATTREHRPVELSWTDLAGFHVITIDRPTTLGSSPLLRNPITDPTVSRVHAEVTARDGGLAIRDLSSTNGTACGTIDLRDAFVRGDVTLRLGRVEIKVRHVPDVIVADVWPRPQFAGLLGRSLVMRTMFQLLADAARTDENVCIVGETGTGKELVARAVHEASPRRKEEFIVVDCGSLVPQLLESELFGHAKGSFSGAAAATPGMFEAANGGTLFLDEIGEMPLELQPKLLRALESRQVRRVGETNYRDVNVRVVSATHRDLRQFVNRGSFREDLFFRLSVVPVVVPTLRERPEDIEMLVTDFLKSHPGAPLPPPEIVDQLAARSWLGNVRELRNLVRLASVLRDWKKALASHDASAKPPADTVTAPPTPTVMVDDRPRARETFAQARERYTEAGERSYLGPLLEKHKGDFHTAAAEAGIDHSYLRRLYKKRFPT